MKTVYVMGAGASKHVGYPLISGMGKQLFEWMAAYPNGMFSGSADLLVERFGKAPNIEDVITEVQSSIECNGTDRVQHFHLVSARQHLFDGLRLWFREIHLNPAIGYAGFADEVIQPGDVVISFNYDDSLERELRRGGKWDVSHGYGFPLGKIEQPFPVLVLKLHGSINWLAAIFGGAVLGTMRQIDPDDGALGHYPVIHEADLEFLGYRNFSGHVYRIGSAAFPALILPGRNKEFFYQTSFGEEWKPFFDHLWLQASEALRQAERLVICGYSMLSVDKRACDMILKNTNQQASVEIVCGSQGKRIADDFRNAGYKDVSFDAVGHFEEWVQHKVPASSASRR
jgi:hypothetical protein